MPRFVKFGQDVIDLDAITSMTLVENQSGLSDKVIIQVGFTNVIVDSAIYGRDRMNKIRENLMEALKPVAWEYFDAVDPLNSR